MPAAAVPLIVGAAAGMGAAALGASLVLAVGIGAMVASAAMALTMKTPSFGDYRSSAERQQVLRAAAADEVVVYGRVISSGLLSFAAEQEGEQDVDEWLHLAITLSAHKLHRLGAVWLGDEPAAHYSEHVSYEFHNDRQTADPYMLKHCKDWKPDMIGRGLSWLRMSLSFNPDKFPSGLPNIRAEKFGVETIYDPRDGKLKWTDNAALIILDYYRSWLQVPDDELDMPGFAMAANICDELVTLADGTTEKRYTINGEFDLPESPAKILEAMHMACAGQPTYVAGRHGIIVGAYYGPATLEIHPHQIIGNLELLAEPTLADRINTVTGTFIDPTSFQKADFPAVRESAWVEEDGGQEHAEDLDLRFVTSPWQAQRLARIVLHQRRFASTMTLSLNLSGWQYRPGVLVKLYLPALGMNGVEFRVTDWDFSLGAGVNLTLRQESAQIWADAAGKPMERPELSGLPTGGVAMPDQLRYEIEQIGETVQGRLYWRNVGQIADNRVVVQRLEPGQPPRTVLTVAAPGQSCPLTGLLMGAYTATVQAVGHSGRLSPPAAVHFDIEAPVTPIGVEVEAGNWSLALRPVWYGGPHSAATCEWWFSHIEHPIGDAMDKAKWCGIAPFMTLQGLRPDTEYFVWLRTVNAYGKSELLAAKARTAYDTDSILDMMDGEIGAEHLRAELRQPIESIQGIALDVDRIKEGVTEIAEVLEDGSLVRSLDAIKASAESAAGGALAAAVAGAESDQQRRQNVGMLTVQQEALATEQEAHAKRLLTLGAQVDENYATLVQESSVRATADLAHSRWLAQVEAKAGQNSAAVQTVSEAVASVKGEVRAGWYTKAQLNGTVAGFGLSVEMSSDGSVLSSFVIDADVFAVLSRAQGETSKRHPFVIKNGRVYINAAIMDMAEIGTLISDYIKVKRLVGTEIEGGSFRGGDIWLGENPNGQFEAYGKRWNAGIDSTGRLFGSNVYFDGGTFRGNVQAISGTFNNVTILENSDVRGTIYANKIVGDITAVRALSETKQDNSSSFTLESSGSWRTVVVFGAEIQLCLPNTEGGSGQTVIGTLEVLLDDVVVSSQRFDISGYGGCERRSCGAVLVRVPPNKRSKVTVRTLKHSVSGGVSYIAETGLLFVYKTDSGTFV